MHGERRPGARRRSALTRARAAAQPFATDLSRAERVRLRRQGPHLRLSSGRRRLRPICHGHYVENTGEDTLTFLEMFRSNHFADVSLSQSIGLLPPELVQAHLNVDETLDALPREKTIIVGGRSPT